MIQKNRIAEFVQGRLDQMEVKGQETALVFGKGASASEVEDFKNEYKCNNAATGACVSNLLKCTNDKGLCHSSINALECTNKKAE